MTLYLLWFLLALIWYGQRWDLHKSQSILFIYLLSLGVFVGLGDMLGGYDRYIYGFNFDDFVDGRRQGLPFAETSLFLTFPKEYGYNLLNVVLSFITYNRYVFIFVLTISIYSLLYFDLKEYADDYPMAVLLFLGLLFFFTFTYLRQIIGAAVVWLSIRYAIRKQFWKFLLVFLIGVSMHNSALIFFPVYFFADKRLDIKNIYRVMALCLVLGLSNLPSALFDIYGEAANMQGRAADYSEDDSGFRIEYVLESLFFLYIIVKNYSLIPNDRKHILLLNMSLAFCAILLLFVKSLNGGRLGWYYLLGTISILTYLSTKKLQFKNFKAFLVIVSFVLFFRILTQWGIMLYPYKTFFTSGHRKGDFVYEKMEYDSNYDANKFYRPALWFMSHD